MDDVKDDVCVTYDVESEYVTKDGKGKSNTKVMPTDGRIVLKIVVNNFHSLNLANMPKDIKFETSNIFIDGTSDNDKYPLNSKVIVEENAITYNMFNLEGNNYSVIAVKKAYEELKAEERREFIKNNKYVTIHLYSIVRFGDIKAIINE